MDKKILVVDDDISIRKMMGKAFLRAGFTPVLAENAEEALEILSNDGINIMFFDLKLPGMNGIELCRKVKKNYPIAIIFSITGYSSIFELAECREAGFDDYFIKPIEISVLISAAENAYEKLSRWKK